MEQTKEAAREWIEAGKPCRYRYGFGYKGASSRPITKEKALELLPKYDFGMGFYELSFCQDTIVDYDQCGPNCTVSHNEGPTVLMFNEYSVSDMD